MTTAEQRRILRENRWISIQMEQYVNHCLAPTGLTAIQAYILLYILRNSEQGTSLTAIHREFGYSMATLSGMLKRLRSKGYVRAEPCGEDDRRKLLFGTEKGQQLQAFLDSSISPPPRHQRAAARPVRRRTSSRPTEPAGPMGKCDGESLHALRGQSEKEETEF